MDSFRAARLRPSIGLARAGKAGQMKLHRTPLTWAIYAGNGAWASFVYLSGPVAPIVAVDLAVPAAWAGLVGTAMAAGIATASAVAPVAIRRLNRDGATRLGLLVVALTLVLVALVPTVLSGRIAFFTILVLLWVASSGGGTLMNASTARLSDIHPQHSGQVITEANAAAGWVGLFSPLLLGIALGVGLGWWAGIAVCVLAALAALGALVLAGRSAGGRDPQLPAPHTIAAADEAYEPPEGTPAGATQGGLPGVFWLAMVALFAAAGAEFALNFWGSTLIVENTGAAVSQATAVMAASVAGIAVGRTIGSWATAKLGPHRMLLGGFALDLVGFFIVWGAGELPLAVAGLFIAGLGLATLFPLVLDRGIQLSGGQADLAMSRSSLVLGLSIGGAPFILGALGSVVSVRTAMLLVPVLVAAGIFGVVMSRPQPAPVPR